MTVHLLYYDFNTPQKQKNLVRNNRQGFLLYYLVVGSLEFIGLESKLTNQTLNFMMITSYRPCRRRPLEAYQLFHLPDRQLIHIQLLTA